MHVARVRFKKEQHRFAGVAFASRYLVVSWCRPIHQAVLIILIWFCGKSLHPGYFSRLFNAEHTMRSQFRGLFYHQLEVAGRGAPGVNRNLLHCDATKMRILPRQQSTVQVHCLAPPLQYAVRVECDLCRVLHAIGCASNVGVYTIWLATAYGTGKRNELPNRSQSYLLIRLRHRSLPPHSHCFLQSPPLSILLPDNPAHLLTSFLT